MNKFVLLFFLLINIKIFAQPTYFPPSSGNTWETTSPAEFNWCDFRIDSLYNYLNAQNTRAFILLKDGKIVLEQYFNGHTQSTSWYWASAGKTLTSFMVGIAQQENFLNIEDATSTYLGQGWTNCTPEQEQNISIWNQLTMTSGLNESPSADCTIDTCLNYLAEPGSRWSYHNAPYTLLDQVIESATGVTLNQYTNQKLKIPIGMTGLFLTVDFNNVYFSDARSMARFGLLIQNRGNWNGNQIMTDTTYFNAMINTSQELNKAYGYLWWLSGKESYMVPGFQFTIPGNITPNAPSDNLMALGRDGQLLNVAPSENITWIRMGGAPTSELVPFLMNDVIWDYINKLECNTTTVAEVIQQNAIQIFPNPFSDKIQVQNATGTENFMLYNALGQLMWEGRNIENQDFSKLNPGIYSLSVFSASTNLTYRLIKE